MAIPTFTVTDPDTGLTVEPEPGFNRVKTAKTKANPFGDSYTQELPMGVNNLLIGPVDVKFSLLDWTTLQSLESFLDNLGGYQPFYYTLPPDTVARKWKSNKYGMVLEKGGIGSFDMTIMEIP